MSKEWIQLWEGDKSEYNYEKETRVNNTTVWEWVKSEYNYENE